MLVQELTVACANGGFKLTKWVSNNRTVPASIPDEKRSKEVKHLDLHRDELPLNSAMTLHWNTESFLFKIALKQQQFTRRGILSVTNSVYDPLGLLALVMLPAKRIGQESCWMNYGWDEEIPAAFAKKMGQVARGAQATVLSNLSFSRCFIPNNFGKIYRNQLWYG